MDIIRFIKEVERVKEKELQLLGEIAILINAYEACPSGYMPGRYELIVAVSKIKCAIEYIDITLKDLNYRVERNKELCELERAKQEAADE